MVEDYNIYRTLQKHLDKQLIRFPKYKSGADIDLLRSIFSPKHAQIAIKLNHKYETTSQIYERVKDIVESEEHLKSELDEMVKKGGIGYSFRDGKGLYRIVPLTTGIFDFQIHQFYDGYIPEFFTAYKEFNDDTLGFGISFLSTKVPQFRIIPIEESISPEQSIMSYDEIEHLIKTTEFPIFVHKCLCREKAELEGNPCKATSRREVCLALGSFAQTISKMNVGREISKAEALEITRLNQKEGLVLNVSNAQKIEWICSCCSCCCNYLSELSRMPRAGQFFQHNYHASVDQSECNGCGICVEKCPMGANKLSKKSKIPKIDLYKCIGCGVCIPACPKECRKLVKNKKEIVPPKTDEEMVDIIMENRKGRFGSFLRVVKRILKSPK